MKKKIHQKIHAGDRCGFLDTPVEFREFTDANDYVEKLEQAQGFKRCLYCQTVQPVGNQPETGH